MVVVFGSINLDLVARVSRFPQPGETLAGDSFATYPGGKGANQALAAARAGAGVAMVGAVGRDAFGAQALAELDAGGVDLSAIRTVDGPTGVAVIEVAASGENTILVIAGANAHADASDVRPEWLRPSTVVVMQQEVPAAANVALALRARAAGARVVLNAAPARAVDHALLDLAHVIVVNETELRALTITAGSEIGIPALATAFATQHGNTVVITLGSAGALAAEPGRCYAIACGSRGRRRLDRCRRRFRRGAGGRAGARPGAARRAAVGRRRRIAGVHRTRRAAVVARRRADRAGRGHARIADDRAQLTPAHEPEPS